MANTQKKGKTELCAICRKVTVSYDCRGCERSFCRKHIVEHNNSLSNELSEITEKRDMLQSDLYEEPDTSTKHPLMNKIDRWEQKATKKIHNHAEKLRNDVQAFLSRSKESVMKRLDSLTAELKHGRENDDYTEVELTHWKETLDDLRKEFNSPPSFNLTMIDDTTWIPQLCIGTDDKFDQVCGNIRISEDSSIATRLGDTGPAQVIGQKCFNTGSHSILLKIERMFDNEWMFWGIISKNTTMTHKSYSSKSSYGWAKNPKQVYLNGKNNDGFNNYDGDIIAGDTLTLLLNCDKHTIELENLRTNKKYTIPVDITKCPFPWQLHVNLCWRDDSIRILS